LKIAVNDAHLKTAIVEIKSLVVSGKQVTLAVFRQLQEEAILTDDLNLKGTPWGRVNYCPAGRRCLQGEHLHIVWQKGSELRRATIEAPNEGPVHLPEADAWIAATLLEGKSLPSTLRDSHRLIAGVIDDDSAPRVAFVLDAFARATYSSEWRNRMEQRSQGKTAEWWLGRMGTEALRIGRDRIAYKERWHEMKALPQLFIAV
jgi:hypothetical protein